MPITQDQIDALAALKCAVSYNRYGAYCVPLESQHRPAVRKILAGDVHEPDTIEFLRSNCSDGDIVHAGTYFGDFLPALSQGIAPGAKVWAFEPNSESYRCAKATVLLNDIANVELFNAGLGARRETLPLLTIDPNGVTRGGASRLISGNPPPTGHTEMVPIVTIDEVIPLDRRVSIIQLDVEGHEQPALAGAMRTISRCYPIIVVEILADSTQLSSNWFTENIVHLGYRHTGFLHGNTVFSPK